MRKNRAWLIALITGLLMFGSFAQAQSQFQAGARFNLGFPQNEFGDELDAIGIGGGGYFAVRIPQSPVLIGVDAKFLIYGSETRKEPWSLTIPDITVDVSTTNSIVQGMLLIRLQQPEGSFKPYLDGLLGFNYLFTSTSVESEWSDENIASSTNYDDGTLAYGFGGGLQFKVWDGDNSDNPDNKLQGVFVDIGIRYIQGGEARYLKKGDIIRNDNGTISYTPSESTTDLLNFHIGASFEF